MTRPDNEAAGRADGPHRRRPTVYQVAELAGVSIATVSRALRADEPVAPETRRRVLAAARTLNWWPSRAAQTLAGEKHDAVAIIMPDLAGPYYAQVVAGFESEVVGRDSVVMVMATHGRAASERLVRDLASRIDGLVVMGESVPEPTLQEMVTQVPVVLLARPALPAVTTVVCENVQAAETLTRHLFDHGRRRLRFVGDPEGTPDVRERWTGFVRAHTDAGVPLVGGPVECERLEAESGYRAGLEVLRDPEVDAVFCANDELASGVYRAAAEVGRTVPGDLAVTGWDDVTLAAHLSPRLTTVRQPMRELGAAAARLLFDQIGGARTPTTVQLDTEVVIRASCGCPG
ncbi:LacI family DNA-binding transcriptional regulator [Micromonospora sp. NBRC 101691]|uniref:LacI family DNA-binding transcriptional regulator n=1 Tax=Micromonospora sp. NBRC 101691 TaxID=3032198 RepID=UPI0024A465DB|nr:LacI family DNA-binding transcriptional regulator [Micromonospora sp. NBRC 101691]GLY20300.1 LacI family transcriptional regulator [Micromonospora sp. NBRC 101691]